MKSKIILLAAMLLCFAFIPVSGKDSTETYKLRMENRRLRAELDRLRGKLAEQDRNMLKFRQWVGSVSDSGRVQTVSERETRLLAMLSELLKRCNRLVIQVSEIQRSFRTLISEVPMGPAKQARLLLQLEELERISMQASEISGVVEAENDPKAFQELRVIAVNRELETAVLSGGSVHGLFPGLIYQGKSDSRLKLRIVSVRPWVSAAVPVDGRMDEITPGMTFSAAHRVSPGEGIRPLRSGIRK